jgi:UDP-N-acetylglucosamine 4,6-dehydratase/5-epimerase
VSRRPDFLPRNLVAGRSVLVTGGTGSFGTAFTRRALDLGARRVVVFSRDEAKQAAMRAALDDVRVRYLIGDVRDAERVMDACRGVDIVVHAAALKRVEKCEADPNEAVATNIRGTQNVARACIERGIKRAVFLSTDKAAAPNTLYGATKLAAERLWCQSNVYAAGTDTRLAATRYGNVLGSTGSVVPLWRAQHAADGTVTVTDPAMTRFWMTMDAAVDLVLFALAEMRGGEVFVPKVGSAPILTLADAVAPGCAVRGVPVRAGEKRHETLLTEDEARNGYDCGTHYRIEVDRTWTEARQLCPGLPLPDGFSYRSDTNPDRLDAATLRAMLGEAAHED